ncbi:MAG TPA: translocation/assembly module TamB domain-containing protein [Bryobacteraceae bacterium]|jgi:translocation and assembly module TamB|nr:translocation/assembly module TamB domain-containing protein [Bryobacteraceae bacterium]
MTRKKKKILLTIAASLLGLILVLVIASILVLRSAWFAGYVREKIIAVAEESTGGVVEIGSFQFEWTHLTVRIRNFILHGTEPKTADPLVRVPVLELRLKLFAGLKKAVDLQYLGIQQPEVDVIVFPDGKTNIPQPKVPQKPSNKSGLETVVDLAVGQFNIQNGLLEFSQQKTPFSARGENLRVLLNYNALNPSYQGNLRIDPLLLATGNRPPMNVHVNLPVTIEKDAIQLAGAKLTTDQSQISLSASMRDMNAPQISAQLNASLSLPEIQRSVELPIDANAAGAPKTLTAELNVSMDEKNNTIQLQTAHIGLGQTTFQAAGAIDAAKNSSVQFNANLALGELTKLMNVSSVAASGDLQANGSAKVDAQHNYAVDGTLNSRGLSVRSGTTRLSDVSLYSPFHADPYLVSMDGLKLNAFGGTLAAKIFLEKMQQLSVEAGLHHLALPVLAAALTGKHLGYDGTLEGSLKAQGDLKAKGASGYAAQARLAILPGNRGVPVSGRLDANYSGASGTVDLDHSYVALPNSRVDLSGALNRRIDVNLVSHNLNDFLPAANFGATKPQASLPVTLQGGAATVQAQISGDLSAPHITSHVAVNRFAVEQRSFDRFALDLAASPSGATIQNGLLTRRALQTTFDASIGLRKWSPIPSSPLAANLTMRNGDVADLLSLAGESSMPASGTLSADVHVNGTYGDPLGGATLQVVNGTAYEQAFDRLYANVNLADRLITLAPLSLVAPAGRIDVNGTFQHPRDSFTTGHAQFRVTTTNIQLADIKMLQKQNVGAGGVINLSGTAAADLREVNKQSEVTVSNIAADLSARNLRVQNQDAGNLTASARTVNGTVNYNLASNFAGSNINIAGRTALAKDYPTTADASIQNLSVEKSLSIAGEGSLPARGNFSANAHVAGTLEAPNADLSFTLARANLYQEPINRLQGSVHYSNTAANIRSLVLDVPAGSLTLSGSFTHPANDFNAGLLQLNVNTTPIQVAKIEHVQQERPDLAGTLRLTADLSATMRDQSGNRTVLISKLNADASANALRMNSRSLGEANFTARTSGSNLNFQFDSDIAQSKIHGSGQSRLAGDYPVNANLTFANIRYANIAPYISTEPGVKPSFDALVEGQVSVNGPVLKPEDLSGRLELTHLEAQTSPQASPTGAPPGKIIEIHNQGPIQIALNHDVLHVEAFHLQGPPGTDVNASGTVDIRNTAAPYRLNVDANADLGILQDADRDFASSGSVALAAAIHGTFSQPLVNGRIELKNANVNYTDSPNGIANGNGVILLNGTSATIQTLTGQSGGGKISMTGFIGYSGETLAFNLRATADRVRTRYSGISLTSNAGITLTGNMRRSVLGGNVSIQRIAYAPTSDAGSILSSFASTPPSTTTAASPLMAGMRLDIHITTAPNLQVVTTYANSLDILTDLRVRGTAADPGVLGRVVVTDGELVFFGNTYTVNTGTINFYNPNSIQPVLNFSLETLAQGVDVTLGVTGPMDNLQLNYRSDPPLSFEQIVQLLATNTTPADPNIAAQQPPAPQQSFTQMGESAVLGQAVADPLASRVQRVFGLSQFKIDPSFSGSNGQPSARVTLQQKIANNITFTYITDVTETNNEIVRVEWDLTPKFSAVGLRDFNGNVSIEFFYKFKVR